MSDRDLFAAALDAVYGQHQPAYAIVQYSEMSYEGAVVTDLRQWNPDQGLPPYTTWSAPTWFDPVQHLNRPGVLVSDKEADNIRTFARAKRHFSAANSIVVMEIDRALVPCKASEAESDYWGREFASRGLPVDYLYRLQMDAVSFALQQSGYPFNVLIDSGGKSVHAVTRLHDDPQWLAQQRECRDGQSGDWFIMEEMLRLALVDIDMSVWRSAGMERLVRAPFGVRDNGRRQNVLAVNQTQFKAQDIYQWARNQLSDECLAFMATQPARNTKSGKGAKEFLLNPYRMDLTRKYGWRDLLLNIVPQGGGDTEFTGRADQMFRLNCELAKAGSRPPKMIARPSEVPPVGKWEASFAWFMQGRVYDALNEGSFFATDERFNEAHRVAWPAPEVVQDKHDSDEERRVTSFIVDAWSEQVQNKVGIDGTVFQEQAPGYAGPLTGRGGSLSDLSQFMGSGGGQPGKRRFNSREHVPGALHRLTAGGQRPVRTLHSSAGDQEARLFYAFEKVWQPLAKGDIEKVIDRWVADEAPFGVQDGFPLNPNRAQMEEILHYMWLGVNDCDKEMPAERYDVAVFPNGTLYWDFETGDYTFRENYFDPADRMFSMLPYAFDPACPTSLWDAMLDNIFDPESKRAFEEMVGVALYTRLVMKTIVLIDGSKNAGKTTLVQVLGDLFGPENCAALGFEQWHKSTFPLDGLEGKRFVMNSEVNLDIKGIDWGGLWGELKKITGGDLIKYEKKGSRAVTAPGNSFTMMASNEDLPLTGIEDACVHRLAVFTCSSFTGRPVDDLRGKIAAQEQPGVANRLIQAVSRWLKRGGFGSSATDFVQSFNVPESVLRLRETRARESQPEVEFMEQLTAADEAGTLYYFRPFWDQYIAWYRDFHSQKGSPGSYVLWMKRLQRHGFQVVTLRSDSPEAAQVQMLPAGFCEAKIRCIVGRRPLFEAPVSVTTPTFTHQDGLRSSKDVPFEKHGTAEDNRPIAFPSRNA